EFGPGADGADFGEVCEAATLASHGGEAAVNADSSIAPEFYRALAKRARLCCFGQFAHVGHVGGGEGFNSEAVIGCSAEVRGKSSDTWGNTAVVADFQAELAAL